MKNKKRKYPELSALKGKLREKKFSYVRIAELMHMTPNTFCNKVNGYYPFNSDEIGRILIILDISASDMAYYFFPNLMRIAEK